MKALKIFGWFLFAISIIHYSVGVFSGEFNTSVGGLIYYGTSMKSIWLSIISAVCLLLSITILFIVLAMREKK